MAELTIRPRYDVNDVPWLGQGVEEDPNCWIFRSIGSSREPVRSGASDDRLAMKSKTVTSRRRGVFKWYLYPKFRRTSSLDLDKQPTRLILPVRPVLMELA